MIELVIIAAIIATGLGIAIGDAMATRRWRNETIARRSQIRS